MHRHMLTAIQHVDDGWSAEPRKNPSNVSEQGATNAAVFRGGDAQPAATELEVEQRHDVALRLRDQIPAGHAEIGGAIRNELRDVGGTDEDCLEDSAE